MQRSTSTVLSVLIVLSLLSACAPVSSLNIVDGQVMALQLGSTVWGIQRAVAGRPDAYVFANQAKDAFAVVWNIKDAWGFFLVKDTGNLVGDFKTLFSGGNVTNVNTISNFTKYLCDEGWQILGKNEMPSLLVRMAATPAQALVQLAQSFPTFLVLPVDAVYQLEEYQQFTGNDGEWH